ncbi:hypothetical protein [Variovorax boronicumulans]|uniref:hypothetical protein n=1 Tax=Variovorax boronicumulans TaxID=436515 RepID=UPI0024745F3C|nr:hypothetical protein [Variovorax boronicumulans]
MTTKVRTPGIASLNASRSGAFDLVTNSRECAVRTFQLTDQVLVDDARLTLQAFTLLRCQRHVLDVQRNGEYGAQQHQQTAQGQSLPTKTPSV